MPEKSISINNKANREQQLKMLKKRMRRDMYLFFFFRNNPRFCNYYYSSLIYIIGLDNWEKVNPAIRNEWNNARFSFDKMFGLLKAYSLQNFSVLQPQEKSMTDQLLDLTDKLKSEYSGLDSLSEDCRKKLGTLLDKCKELSQDKMLNEVAGRKCFGVDDIAKIINELEKEALSKQEDYREYLNKLEDFLDECKLISENNSLRNFSNRNT